MYLVVANSTLSTLLLPLLPTQANLQILPLESKFFLRGTLILSTSISVGIQVRGFTKTHLQLQTSATTVRFHKIMCFLQSNSQKNLQSHIQKTQKSEKRHGSVYLMLRNKPVLLHYQKERTLFGKILTKKHLRYVLAMSKKNGHKYLILNCQMVATQEKIRKSSHYLLSRPLIREVERSQITK